MSIDRIIYRHLDVETVYTRGNGGLGFKTNQGVEVRTLYTWDGLINYFKSSIFDKRCQYLSDKPFVREDWL